MSTILCKFEGCTRRTSRTNKTGLCTDHRPTAYCVICDSVLGPSNKSGYCKKHHKLSPEYKEKALQYQRERNKSRGGHPEKRRSPGEISRFISGTLPTNGEYCVYALSIEGEVFYVGSTKEPLKRIYSHLFTWGEEIIMTIIKNIPPEDVLYWECRMIVEYIDAGYKLSNTKTPQVKERSD